MFNQKQLAVFSMAILLALLFTAVLPLTALADDGMPPQPEDAPVVVDESATEEPAEAPVVAEPATEEPPADASVEDLTVPQILEAAPEGTDLVVLDGQGAPLPLVTEEAGQVLVSGDPMWCPYGVLPGGAGCSAKHSSFSALITDLETNPALSGAGTIYIAYDYDAVDAGDAGSDIVFDYSLVNLYGSLALQGGWNFATNTRVGTSTIANTNLIFAGWGDTDGGTLTFNNLLIDGGFLRTEDLDDFTTEADITLNNVTVTNSNTGVGIDSGIGITTTGDIVLNNVNAFDNKLVGVMAQSTAGDVTVNGGVFENNGWIGVLAYSETGDATLNNVTATGSMLVGGYGWAGKTLTVNGGQFNNNLAGGLLALSDGDVILNDVTATGNGQLGALISAKGDVTVNRGNFSNNAEGGIQVESLGDVTLNNVIATGDTSLGAVVATGGNISVVCGNYNGLSLMIVDKNIYLGGPIITGSGLVTYTGTTGTITYGECPKPVEDNEKDQPGDGGEQNTEAPVCNGEKKVTLKAGDAFGVYEKLCGFEFQLTEADALPGALPSDATEIASLNVQLTSGGTPQDALPAGGRITLKFPIPEGTDVASLVILFWNGSEWVEVSGGKVVDGFYVVQVEKPGNYVLVAR